MAEIMLHPDVTAESSRLFKILKHFLRPRRGDRKWEYDTEMNDKELSKYLSLLLRHQPEKLNIELDNEGFTSLPNLITKMQAKPRWAGLHERDVRRVVRESDKQRYEIVDDRIRARYGHSVPKAVSYDPIEPPEILYHGTSPGAAELIAVQGLRPMNRQYVHLSTEVHQAMLVGRRHHPRPILLSVRAREAHAAGVVFHLPEPRLYISGPIPAEYIDHSEG